MTVRPQVSGVLTSMLFTEGQMVKKGQLLATIDPRPFEIALQQAIGARMRDEAQLENARVQLQRYQTLLGQDSIARQDVDTQAAAVKQLEATLVIDRANENTARLNLGYTRIVAPVAGRVGLRTDRRRQLHQRRRRRRRRRHHPARRRSTSSSRCRRTAFPRSRRASAAARRLAVAALDRTRTKKLDDGTFSTLDNQIDVQTGTVKAKARFANAANSLFPNQFVNVRLLLRSVDGAVVVPVTALRTGPNGDFVYVLNADRTVSVRPVQRGVSTNEVIAVTRASRPASGSSPKAATGCAKARGCSSRASGRRRRCGAAASGGRRGASRRCRGAASGGRRSGASAPDGG